MSIRSHVLREGETVIPGATAGFPKMSDSVRPLIVVATQHVEGNVPGMRLIRVCAEFGEVKVITNQHGADNTCGLRFQRLVPGRNSCYRGLAAIARRAGKLLPVRLRRRLLTGWLEVVLGIKHQGRGFSRLWKKHRLRPVLLVLDGAEFTTTAGRLARMAGSGVVYYVHEMFPNQEDFYTRPLVAFLRRLEKQECHAASHIIVQHPLWGKLLRRRYRLPARKFVEVTPSPPCQEPLPGSGPHEPLRLYYHGFLVANRGLSVLLRAVGLVPEVQLDLRGQGAYEPKLRAIAAESGAGDRIRFLPPVPTAEIAASARSYDLGVVTGKPGHLNGRMSAGIKLYENIAAGIGLFGYRALTLRSTARRLGIGFTYDSSSPEALAGALRYCVSHREDVAAARRRAAEAAREFYNEHTQVERLRCVIREALMARGVKAGDPAGNTQSPVTRISEAQA